MYETISPQDEISSYQPDQDICNLTNEIRKDAFFGQQILERPYVELNNRSVIQDENHGQLMFNAFVDTEVEDPNEAWKWRGTRSMARNKAIAMHANLTASFLLPMYSALNDQDEVDQEFSELMRDIIEWMAEPSNSNYQSSFLQVVFGALTNPVTYMGAEYCEVFQKIKEMQADGSYTIKQILDEVLSGFKCPVYSSSQILITNAYERNIQKQRRVIKRYYAEKKELEAKYGMHKNWGFVQDNGVRSLFNEENGLFYDVKDRHEKRNLCLVETSMCRREDSEIVFINGIYFGDDDIEMNAMKHRDNRNAPKINVVPFGYSRIGEHYFYYKSMMNCLSWDNMYYDGMSEITMNRALLETEFPVAISGSDKFDSDVVFPNSVVSFENENTKITKLMPDSNSNFAFEALDRTEKSMTDASLSETASGQLPDASQKAYTVAQAAAASKKLISAQGKSIAESILMYGDLMKDIAINNITAPQVDLIVGEKMALKYRSFLVQKKSGTKKKTKKIKFDPDLIGLELTDDAKTKKELKMLEESGYPNSDSSLHSINPEKFAELKYLTSIEIEEMFPKNQEYWQPVLLNLKQALAMDPFTNQEELTKKLMYSYFQSDADDMINKKPSAPAMPGANPQGGNTFGAMVQNKQLAGAAGNVAGQ